MTPDATGQKISTVGIVQTGQLEQDIVQTDWDTGLWARYRQDRDTGQWALYIQDRVTGQ